MNEALSCVFQKDLVVFFQAYVEMAYNLYLYLNHSTLEHHCLGFYLIYRIGLCRVRGKHILHFISLILRPLVERFYDLGLVKVLKPGVHRWIFNYYYLFYNLNPKVYRKPLANIGAIDKNWWGRRFRPYRRLGIIARCRNINAEHPQIKLFTLFRHSNFLCRSQEKWWRSFSFLG